MRFWTAILAPPRPLTASIRYQKPASATEDRGQRTEDGRQRTEDTGQRTEDIGQDRGQDGRQRTEDIRQRLRRDNTMREQWIA